VATPNIVESQIIQRTIDQIIVRVVPTEEFTDADESVILNAYKARLGDGMSVRVEKVDGIHQTSSFKKRWIVSELSEDVFEWAMRENKAS